MRKIRFSDTQIVFREVPGETTLAVNITGCPFRCRGCHSPWLQKEEGESLTFDVLDTLVERNPGITCISFMGGDAFLLSLRSLCEYARNKWPRLKLCWYSGQDILQEGTSARIRENGILQYLDFVKFGPYDEELGALDSPTTNQKFFKIRHRENGGFDLEDITPLFRQ